MIVFDVRVHNGDEIKHRVKRDGRVKFLILLDTEQ